MAQSQVSDGIVVVACCNSVRRLSVLSIEYDLSADFAGLGFPTAGFAEDSSLGKQKSVESLCSMGKVAPLFHSKPKRSIPHIIRVAS